MQDKLKYVMQRAATKFPGEIGNALLEMVSPAAIATTAGIFAVWAGAQFTPYGWAADVAIVGVGYAFLGKAVWDVIWGVWDSASLIVNAKCEDDLNKAGDTLAHGLGSAVVAAGASAGPAKVAKLLKSVFKKPAAGAGGGPGGGPTIEPGVPSLPRDGSRTSIDQLRVGEVGGVACGPTSCAMILGDLGIPVNILDFAKKIGIGPQGTDPYQLLNGMKALGISHARVKNKLTLADLKAATSKGHSAIAQVKLSGSFHYVVIDGVTRRPGLSSEELVAIRDPWKGTQYFLTATEFLKKFNGWGVLTNPK
jgi:filamentous hemagglutinin